MLANNASWHAFTCNIGLAQYRLVCCQIQVYIVWYWCIKEFVLPLKYWRTHIQIFVSKLLTAFAIGADFKISITPNKGKTGKSMGQKGTTANF